MSSTRREAREAGLRVLYFWEVGRTEPRDAIDVYFREHAPEAKDSVLEFASALVIGTVDELVSIDRLIEEHSKNWRLERLAVVDRLILRMATWELLHRNDTDAAVVIDEAIELTRRFSTADATRFVNGVLDSIRKALDAGDNADRSSR